MNEIVVGMLAGSDVEMDGVRPDASIRRNLKTAGIPE